MTDKNQKKPVTKDAKTEKKLSNGDVLVEVLRDCVSPRYGSLSVGNKKKMPKADAVFLEENKLVKIITK
jgi:hypothetical protein